MLILFSFELQGFWESLFKQTLEWLLHSFSLSVLGVLVFVTALLIFLGLMYLCV